MKIKHGYIQNPESIPADCKGAGWIYFSEDDKSIYLDSGNGPVKYSGVNEADVDLSNYYTKEETNDTIKNMIPSLDGYATELYVDEKIENIQIPSLEGYATESFVSEKIENIDLPSLEEYAKLTDIPNLDGYAKTEDIPSLEEYAKIEDIPSLEGYAKIEDLENISLDGYATEQYVNDKIASIEIPSTDNFVTKDELSILNEYVKTEDVQGAIDSAFDEHLNSYGITARVMYLSESEWNSLKNQVDSGEMSWEKDVIYMVYSND